MWLTKFMPERAPTKPHGEKVRVTMTNTNATKFDTDLRAEWVALGRPADPANAYWATVLEAEADRVAGKRGPQAYPLVTFGGAA